MIRLENISYKIGAKQILKNLNIELKPGSIIGLVAPNGEGKSTLIKILAGIYTDYTGDYYFDNKNFSFKDKENIGYVPDNIILPSYWSVLQSVDYYNNNFSNFNKEKALELIDKFNIDITEKIESLSKGNIEKLQIALAISIKAKIYLLDEPLSSIDILAKEEILKTILDSYNYNSIIIIASHLLMDIEKIIDRAVLLKEGEIIKDVLIDDIRENGKNLISLYREVFRK